MGQIEVLSPIAEIRTSERLLARRDGSIQGKTVGFLNNRKANASLLLDHVESLMHERCGDFSVLKGDKNAALAAPEEVMAGLSTCAVVVVAIGD
jgi:hypothetical protein